MIVLQIQIKFLQQVPYISDITYLHNQARQPANLTTPWKERVFNVYVQVQNARFRY